MRKLSDCFGYCFINKSKIFGKDIIFNLVDHFIIFDFQNRKVPTGSPLRAVRTYKYMQAESHFENFN